VLEIVIAGRSVAELICRLNPCALVVSSGDRDDVMLATALAASKGVQLAGLLLTHSSSIDPRIEELSSMAFDTGLPVMRVDLDERKVDLQIVEEGGPVPGKRQGLPPPASRKGDKTPRNAGPGKGGRDKRRGSRRR
jgi:phosphate acetyltransferase